MEVVNPMDMMNTAEEQLATSMLARFPTNGLVREIKQEGENPHGMAESASMLSDDNKNGENDNGSSPSDALTPTINDGNYGEHLNDDESANRQLNDSIRPPSCHLKEEFESGDELPPPEEIENAPIHEIRCGLLTAKLHMRRFTCPGIHRKCVEFEGKLISPRQFTIKAEKDKQKDWKGSIRLGKHNLRTLMEMKTLDFFEHATNCSLKCQSRNYIKNRKNESGSNGAEGQQISFVDGQDNGNGGMANGFEMGEPHDIKSVASSSSAASTRKSSAVLEDYVSQTIPSMGFGGYCGATEQLSMNGFGSEEMHQNGHKTPQSISSVHSQQMPSTPSANNNNPSVAASQPQILHHNSHPQIHRQQQSPFRGATPLNLLQQSPLKQLFGTNKPTLYHPENPLSAHQQHQQSPHFAAISNGNSTANKLAGTRPATATTSILPPSLSAADVSQDAALAILLQSVQTSILLEQQQKAAATAATHSNNPMNGNNNSLLAQLVSINALQNLSNPAIGGAANLAATLNGGASGIERLLTAAALFPQLQPHSQHQKTPIKEPVNVQNIRKSMEENPVMFWSQMRNMGLLEDMLKILSDTLEKLKQIYLTGGNAVSEEFAAQRLSGVALALDLCSLFGEKIHSRYIQATLESTLINKELMELQRKQDEQRRKLENVKRKSQVFDQLLKNGGVASNGLAGGHHRTSANGNVTENGAPELKKIHLNI